MDEANEILGEISYTEIQEMLNDMLGDDSFSVADYLTTLLQGKSPVSFSGVCQTIFNGVLDHLVRERQLYLSLIFIAVLGAVFSNFSKLLQGKRVAETAFYVVYLLFFSSFLTLFLETSQLAAETLTKLLEFMKVLFPAFFIAMGFTDSALAAGAYYESVLAVILLVDLVLLKFAFPAVQIFFMLKIADQFSEQKMFSKMAELIRDIVNFVMKTMFGLVMGFQVIQGLLLPVSSKVETSSVIRLSGAVPGVGNAISSIANTLLCAGTLVKNSVGVVGVIAVAFYCGIPLLKIISSRFLFQMTGALVQPVSDPRITGCFGAAVESMKLLVYALFVGGMMFVLSITIISVMTS